MKRIYALPAAALLLASTLNASPVAADTAPGAAQGMSSMRFLLGTWTCSVKAVDGSTPQVTTVSTMSPDGAKMLSRTVAGGDGGGQMWLDASKREWTQTTTATKGSSSQTSPGWNGNTLVWTGTLTANGMPTFGYRTTVTKISDTKTTQIDELSAPGGTSWIAADSAICAKGS
ncbi:MAG TPA: hypothetical protein VK216_02035 [Magnetospirillaceae bacterium]|nr:hypothetical protein [Magnetospirillaceae bacterium]